MPEYMVHYNTIIKLKDEHTFLRDKIHYDIELIHIVKGRFRVSREGETYVLEAGDTYIAFPFETHIYERIGDNLSVLVIFNPDSYEQLSKYFNEYRPESPVVRGSQISPGFSAMMLRMAQLAAANGNFGNSDAENHKPEARFSECAVDNGTVHNYLVALISELIGAMKLVRKSHDDLGMIGKILNYCTEHLSDPNLSVESVANAVGISAGHVSRLFRTKLEIAFTDLIHKQRVEDARVKLALTSATMTEIAYACGFSSVRSFNRIFLQECGMTPSLYRSQIRSGERSLSIDPELTSFS